MELQGKKGKRWFKISLDLRADISNLTCIHSLCYLGGTLISLLGRWLRVRVRALGGILGPSRYCQVTLLTVALSVQVYKWVPANLMLGSNAAMDSYHVKERVKIHLDRSRYSIRS